MKKTHFHNNVSTLNQPLALLGEISPEEFLTEYWQKKPLLIRNAIPNFQGLISPDELAGLACEEDVQSRLISFNAKRWKLEQGPLDEDRFAQLPAQGWTLLVQELNHHLEEASELLQQFNFIPYARLDDLMVSYAPDGGGVGPHYDSYDVFLLQGLGQRLWRISEQDDLSLEEGAPLRILKHFHTEQEWVLSPGDMLYLPPHVAHWGIAVGECMTYSIGFRAPSAQEFGSEFLNYLQERKTLIGQYHDPDLAFQNEPAEIGDFMISKISRILEEIKWDDGDVGDFIGHYLTEPKAHIFFDIPNPIMSLDAFENKIMKIGIKLSLKSQMLVNAKNIYLNGDKIDFEMECLERIKMLANNRILDSNDCHEIVKNHPSLMNLFFDWYRTGYLIFLNE